MRTDGLQEIVDGLADRLQRSVAVDDPAIHLIVASKHYGDEDPVRVQSVLGREVTDEIAQTVLSGIDQAEGHTRLPAMPQFDSTARVCFPVRYAKVLLGYLWLIDKDESLTDEEITETAAALETIALLMYRHNLDSERRQSLHDGLLRELLAADPAARLRAEADIEDEGVVGDPSSATVVAVQLARSDTGADGAGGGASSHDAAELALAQAVRQTVGAYPDMDCLTSLQRRRAVLLVTGRHSRNGQLLTEVCRRVVDSVGRVTRRRAVAGIGLAQEGLGKAAVSYDQALVAARAAEFLPGLGSVLQWESLGVYALLAQIPPHEAQSAAYPVPLLRLARSKNAEVLMSTAEVYLDYAGDAQRAADTLHIHRTTLYQRIGRIEEVSGLDLRDGLDRLTLHLGLKMARLTGSFDRIGLA
ncbi:carbohydrate diacid transcriptional activator CdaR [Streptomyces sp. YIM 130001]|uniref:PucR family transcriptional regulator n=1 Tax=Streptomyces sp. YIM 130001 TaxID=2259644 RepID=UPI000E657D24|nr:helix-turn-helix domain-containing protein [Streptomyces sp. YIM 130001]RII20648.1 carbohydrate diacid transcriptional activator CdaR [Streptomyces sp. YIM 130001]